MSKLKNKIISKLNEYGETDDAFSIEQKSQEIDNVLAPMGMEPEQEVILKAKALNKELDSDDDMELTEFDNDAVGRGIESGMNPESGVDFDGIQDILNQMGSDNQGLDLTKTNDDGVDELPFDNPNPSMTKDELMESVISKKKKPTVIKRVKIKDIRNGK